jgi:hypothetical protein
MKFKLFSKLARSVRIIIKPLLAAFCVLLLISLYTGQLGQLVDQFDYKTLNVSTVLKGAQSTTIEFPDYKTQSPKFSKALKDQWMGDKGNFVLVSQENTPYYTEPSLTANKIGTLSFTQRVQLIFIVEKMIEDENSVWGFVTYEGGKVPVGWVNMDNLARPSFFTPLNSWDFEDFIYKKGHYIGDVHANKSGKFFIKWVANGNGLKLKGKHFGDFYVFDNILWAKKNEFNIWKDFFYEDKDGLKQEYRFSEGLLKKLEMKKVSPPK